MAIDVLIVNDLFTIRPVARPSVVHVAVAASITNLTRAIAFRFSEGGSQCLS